MEKEMEKENEKEKEVLEREVEKSNEEVSRFKDELKKLRVRDKYEERISMADEYSEIERENRKKSREKERREGGEKW